MLASCARHAGKGTRNVLDDDVAAALKEGKGEKAVFAVASIASHVSDLDPTFPR
jgi:hypothetical protein